MHNGHKFGNDEFAKLAEEIDQVVNTPLEKARKKAKLAADRKRVWRYAECPHDKVMLESEDGEQRHYEGMDEEPDKVWMAKVLDKIFTAMSFFEEGGKLKMQLGMELITFPMDMPVRRIIQVLNGIAARERMLDVKKDQ